MEKQCEENQTEIGFQQNEVENVVCRNENRKKKNVNVLSRIK